MADMNVLSLQQFMASLDKTCLPKILQICSGVYFQGSIYELSGHEVCFSTGDLFKVIDFDLLAVSCEDISSKQTFELPADHKGLFKMKPDEMPYSSVEEMVKMRPVSISSSLPFTFTSCSKMTFDNLTLGAGKNLTVLSMERRENEEYNLRCHVEGHQDASAEVCIPLSTRGEFRVCEGMERYTLQEIVSSPFLCSQRFCLINSSLCERPLLLSPVYTVHAVMNLRKNVLKFPSSLEVDVLDVTDMCMDVNFVTPLSLTEVMSTPDESFPAVVEILGIPESRPLLKCNWLSELRQSTQLIFHRKGESAMMLISTKSRKAQQYFLVSQQYGGRFRRRPREFNSVYELYVASMQTPGLRVRVTRNSEEIEEEGLPALDVGDQLEMISFEKMELHGGGRVGQRQFTEALLCRYFQDLDDGDEEEEEEIQQDQRKDLYLPLYMQGLFVEVITDNKKYSLRDLGMKFKLPIYVKLVSRDAELEADPLAGFPCLRIEGTLLEPTILASFLHMPDHCFEIPAQRLSLTVSLTKNPLPQPMDERPKCRVDTVTEVTDTVFYEFRKQVNSEAAPPPRPPKGNLSKSCKKPSNPSSRSSSAAVKPKLPSQKSIPTKEFSDLTLNSKRQPPAPPASVLLDDPPPPVAPQEHQIVKAPLRKAQPNTYVGLKESKRKVPVCDVQTDVDSDHEYEHVDQTLSSMVKNTPENFIFW
ncbi:protein THEMIS2 [Aulostomus maculatus]